MTASNQSIPGDGGRLDHQINEDGSNVDNEHRAASVGSGVVTNPDGDVHGTLMSISCKTSNLVRDDQVENAESPTQPPHLATFDHDLSATKTATKE